MTYAVQFDYIGVPGINLAYTPDTTQRAPIGATVTAVDPYFQAGDFFYGKATGTITAGQLVTWDKYDNVTACPNTANLGAPVGVALLAFTTGQFGWFQIAGTAPLSATASVAQGTTFGITAAGQVGANTAGKQVLNAKSAGASTLTVVKAGCNTLNGSATLQVPNSDGWFIGITLSGTGISGTVTAISPDGRSVTMSANATATGAISATGTYTGFILASFDRPFSQGAIT